MGSSEVEGQLEEDARRIAFATVPFMFLVLILVRLVLGSALDTFQGRLVIALQIMATLTRMYVLAFFGRHPTTGDGWRQVGTTGTAWLVSASLAMIYLSALPLDSVKLLELTLVSAAISAIALNTMIPHPITYAGYVALQMGPIGYLIVRANDPSLTPAVPVMIVSFLAILAVTAKRARLAQRERANLTVDLRESSLRDSLTGLRNRRFAVAFAEQRSAQLLAQTADSWRRPSQTQLAFMLVDLDHFKSVNDRYGHAAGDQVLSAFANLATRTLRAHDVIARWGGEEFLVIMEVGGIDDARAIAERLRSALHGTPVAISTKLSVSISCSIGCALLAAGSGVSPSSWQSAIDRADECLYSAKASGRNQCRVASSLPESLRNSISRPDAVSGLTT